MKKLPSFLNIPIFFILLFLAKSGILPLAVFILFIPLYESIPEKNEKIRLHVLTVFLLGCAYITACYPWLSSFASFAVPLVAILGSLLYFVVPYTLLSLAQRQLDPGNFFLFITSAASIWVFFEYILQRYPIPFPYNSIAFCLYRNTALLQILDIAGQFGLTFLILLINGFFYMIIRSIIAGDNIKLLRTGIVLTTILGIWITYGMLSPHLLTYQKEINIDLAQSSMLGPEKASLDEQAQIDYFRHFLSMVSEQADLLIFPETFFYSNLANPNNPVRIALEEAGSESSLSISGGFIEITETAPEYIANSLSCSEL